MEHEFRFTPEELKRYYLIVHECSVCGERFAIEVNSDTARAETEARRTRHLADVHGLSIELEGPLSFEESLPQFVTIPDWLPPAKALESVPKDQEKRYRWLLPVCERIAASDDPRSALHHLPASLENRVDYVRLHFSVVRATQALKRYQRLKGIHAKAMFLAKALADPDRGPSYAEQFADF